MADDSVRLSFLEEAIPTTLRNLVERFKAIEPLLEWAETQPPLQFIVIKLGCFWIFFLDPFDKRA